MSTYWKVVPEDKARIFGNIDPEEWREFTVWDTTCECGLLNLTLALRKKGVPIIKPTEIEARMSGEQLVAITPYEDEYDWDYEKSLGIKTEERRMLPREKCEELIKEIKWFPTGEW